MIEFIQSKQSDMKYDSSLDDVFFGYVVLKDMPGIIHLNQSIRISKVNDSLFKNISAAILNNNLKTGDGIFSLSRDGHGALLTYTQKIIASTIRNKNSDIDNLILYNGMIHLKSILFDVGITAESAVR